MNPFKEASKIEKRGMPAILDFIRSQSLNGQFVTTEKGRLSKEIQKTIGDVIFNDAKHGKMWAVEVKCEQRNPKGNLFLETWSNKKRGNPGWLVKLKTDILMYYFIEPELLIVLDFRKLVDWTYGKSRKGNQYRIQDYREVEQKKYDQKNDTWGRLVAINDMVNEIGASIYRLGSSS